MNRIKSIYVIDQASGISTAKIAWFLFKIFCFAPIDKPCTLCTLLTWKTVGAQLGNDLNPSFQTYSYIYILLPHSIHFQSNLAPRDYNTIYNIVKIAKFFFLLRSTQPYVEDGVGGLKLFVNEANSVHTNYYMYYLTSVFHPSYTYYSMC